MFVSPCVYTKRDLQWDNKTTGLSFKTVHQTENIEKQYKTQRVLME